MLRRTIAACSLAAASIVTVAGIAGAQTTPSTTPSSKAPKCVAVPERLVAIDARAAAINANIAALQAARAQLAGDASAVARIDVRLQKAQLNLQKNASHKAELRARCPQA